MNKYNSHKIVEWGYYIFILSIALFLRTVELSNRAMHHDESMHAYYSWQLHEGFGLVHNPMLHGPLQMELTAIIFTLVGDSDFTARILYAIFGTILVGLPFLFRSRLGTWGAIFTSLFLCFSPSMVYFSRFARNDIIIAVFTFGLIIAIWKFFQTQKPRYLLLISFLLALSFGTKESAFLITAIILSYCLLEFCSNIANQTFALIKSNANITVLKLCSTFTYILKREAIRGTKYTKAPAYISVFIIVSTLTLPQWAAFSGILQNTFLLKWSGIILLSETGMVGMPSGTGNLIALLLTITLGLASIFIGYRWHWKIWWQCALIFYVTWVLIYTTGLSNFISGIKTGVWQSLGYWIVQQGEGRGGQPEYYYLILTSIYEYFPFVISIAGIIYYLKKPNKFAKFLIYWVLVTFIIYTVASEKMPWLLVNIVLPMIVFSGYFIGIVFEKIIKHKVLNKMTVVFTVCAIVLFCLSVRTSLIASFVNSDIPKEMLVYTQTSPDLKESISIIKEIDGQSDSRKPNIYIDSTSGYTWPWAWYLRNRKDVTYGSYPNSMNIKTPEILIIHPENYNPPEVIANPNSVTLQKIPHRWWFPEETYRELSIPNLIQKNTNFQSLQSTLEYWLNRSNIGHRIGSEDFYIVYLEGFKPINLIADEVRNE
ncbi:MAG: flippase activity-associated protein Agl23 [Dehalococcoidia bacterium]